MCYKIFCLHLNVLVLIVDKATKHKEKKFRLNFIKIII